MQRLQYIIEGRKSNLSTVKAPETSAKQYVISD